MTSQKRSSIEGCDPAAADLPAGMLSIRRASCDLRSGTAARLPDEERDTGGENPNKEQEVRKEPDRAQLRGARQKHSDSDHYGRPSKPWWKRPRRESCKAGGGEKSSNRRPADDKDPVREAEEDACASCVEVSASERLGKSESQFSQPENNEDACCQQDQGRRGTRAIIGNAEPDCESCRKQGKSEQAKNADQRQRKRQISL